MDIIIVDDQQIVREGLKMILSLHEEINIVGEASNGEHLLDLLKQIRSEIILMDIRMPIMDGIEATKLVKERYPDIKVIILTTFNDSEYIFTGLKSGADGYILKDSDSQEIIDSIKTACEGNILLNPKVTLKVVKALNSVEHNKELVQENNEKEQLVQLLTPREKEVAKQIMEGKSNKAISEALFITEGTVKNYVSRILEKLQMNNRTELSLYLQKHM
ncbi:MULTISPECIES: response regulator transcription factor [Bacillus amyloliquefaciens group]|uniref:response regulator transcription factor n=1 Tax=Bacillus amyloliquefaciens group TaxID=1938374 RepID=UPI001362C810|nr:MULTISPECIES: response regulator transcription factor [Bacillus amyloliquefaciens group]MBO3648981.1 response regulator transcription factor [Bacillus amyloliquefaciens]MCJ2176835.1 response regulator transcription factor [Bacillus amyloliquefaciens]MCR4351256.1 response regulator transcription factor [Bacillus amyloliquefaciens]MCR4359633.1 response regulator transcription factor [Bacillus amyloliquefaciens]MDX7985668.1 response regulator transcription factor [Bacillus velezensis]